MHTILDGTRHDRLFPGDRGRKKIAQTGSGEAQFRPQRRFLHPSESGDDLGAQGGKRALRPRVSEEAPRAEKRHNLPADLRSGYDTSELTFPSAPKALVTWNGKNARNFISKERSLEVECGMKVKIGARQMRNGITQRNPGDKLYAHVDYSPGFFSAQWVQDGILQASTLASARQIIATTRATSGDRRSHCQKSHRTRWRGRSEPSQSSA